MRTTRIVRFACAAALALSVASAQPTGPDLLGRVTNPDGSPITNATVLIYSAAPVEGPATVCASCFPDCRKQVLTSPTGEFEIQALEPTLVFRLLVLAPAYESKFIDKVAPTHGPVAITLQPLAMDKTPPEWRIAGLVIGDDGQPVVGATIMPAGRLPPEMSNWVISVAK